MSQSIKLGLLLLLSVSGLGASAQQAKPAADHKNHPKIFKPTSYLGNSQLSSGPIKKDEFVNYIRQGVKSHDSTGKKYKVIGFDFVYVERNLYEDSAGNMMIMPEMFNDHCFGENIPPRIDTFLKEHIKSGDTVYVDHVQVVRYKGKTTESLPDSTAFLGASMKFIIAK